MPGQSFSRSARWRFGLAAAPWALVATGLPFVPFSIVWTSFLPPLAAAVALTAVFVVYASCRPSPRLAATALVTVQVTIFAVGMEILNYLSFAWERPLFDTQLVALDAAIGFHWPSFVAWLLSLPYAGTILLSAYSTTLLQVPAIIVLLGLTGRMARLDRFTLAFMIGATITVGFWIAFPSFGAFHYYFSLDYQMPTHGLAVDPAYAQHMSSWHEGAYVPLRLGEMHGLIAFPSFHTVLALISTVAVWGLRWVGPVFAILNTLVLLSVPAQGGHHMVDVFAGAVVALVAWRLAVRIADGAQTAAGTATAPLVSPSGKA